MKGIFTKTFCVTLSGGATVYAEPDNRATPTAHKLTYGETFTGWTILDAWGYETGWVELADGRGFVRQSTLLEVRSV